MSPTSAARKSAAVGLAAFVALTIGVATDVLTGLDQSIADAGLSGDRSSVLYWPARVGFSLGQNWVFPLASAVVAVILAGRRRSARPIGGLLGVWLVHLVVIGAVKLWADRPPPANGNPHLHAGGLSFPSGHAANILVFSATLGVLLVALTGDQRWFRRTTLLGVGAATICVVSMVGLGFHWATDAAAGLALGTALRALMTPLFASFACNTR
ncbi:phosphatase PAP2 family protein [Cryptosporangium phraense]|uniref:Phosphatase PAP2 family protein n=1 Tax=Cryptosporangium phraense TaxID=2593070 RepID=A0A545AYY8_9ACTN|nr:phosphatase PAP2 family protein [Cryptosporangium phraense]TQS46541.1 phosphatase PAP2 family protein [Cryptosporangium phraense]